MPVPVNPADTLGPAPSVNPNASAHTLQAFIQLVYVKTANFVLVQNLGSLENSLSITNSVLNSLTGIQNMKNLLTVNSKGKFIFTSGGGYSQASQTLPKAYTASASAFYGTPVTVSPNIGNGSTLAKNVTNFFLLKNELQSELSALLPLSPTVPSGTSTTVDPTSLYAKLKIVYNEMTNFVGATATSTTPNAYVGIQNWIIDNYNSVSTSNASLAGEIQQNVTNAITAAQSLNTTQANSVRNYLYIFQEYYKSAATVLTAINTIIVQMANAIKG